MRSHAIRNMVKVRCTQGLYRKLLSGADETKTIEAPTFILDLTKVVYGEVEDSSFFYTEWKGQHVRLVRDVEEVGLLSVENSCITCSG